MILFSRSFIRRRAISLATTAWVAATSFALAQDPMRTHQVRAAMPVQYVAERLGNASEESFLSENDAAMRKMMADMMIKPTGDSRLAQEIVAKQHQKMIVMSDRDEWSSPAQSSRRVRPRAEVPPQSAPTDGLVAQGGLKMSQ